MQNINPLTNVAAGIPATAGIIFRNFLSGKRRINNNVKPIETAKHDPWFSRAYGEDLSTERTVGSGHLACLHPFDNIG
jgi:hypothetical protein